MMSQSAPIWPECSQGLRFRTLLAPLRMPTAMLVQLCFAHSSPYLLGPLLEVLLHSKSWARSRRDKIIMSAVSANGGRPRGLSDPYPPNSRPPMHFPIVGTALYTPPRGSGYVAPHLPPKMKSSGVSPPPRGLIFPQSRKELWGEWILRSF